jgi:hypothetical protein
MKTRQQPANDEPATAVTTATKASVTKVTVSGTNFSLGWDDATEAVTYNVFVRIHDGTEWKAIASGVATPSLVISTSMLSYGVYDFAVSHVTEDEIESEKHTSLDTTADPATGWYVEWIQ